MTQRENREFLIRYLLNETEQYKDLVVPETDDEQKMLLRSLFNIRMPRDVSEEFLRMPNRIAKQEENENQRHLIS